MTFTVENFANEIGFGLSSSYERINFDKINISSLIVGSIVSLWRSTGFPTQGAIPTAAALCTKALTGAMAFANEVGGKENYIGWAYYVAVNAGHASEIHDRLAHFGGLSGTVTTAQAVTMNLEDLALPAARRGPASYSDCTWFLEWYASTGSTAVTATVNVTYDDDSTGNVTVSIPASTPTARMIAIQSAVAGRYIKGVNTVTLSGTTGTAGNIGVTATRQLTTLESDVGGKGKDHTWAMLGVPRVIDDACLAFIMPVTTTTSGGSRGVIKLVKV